LSRRFSVAGGPVNGVPWTGMLGAGVSEIASAASRGRTDPDNPAYTAGIIVPTVLQMAADTLNYWTSMTCLYDPNWAAEEGWVTLPVCMFHVKKITPAFSNEVSKKRVILFEPEDDGKLSAGKLASGLRPQVMQTVADNIVKNPRTYNMEIIVPFQPVGRYISEGVKTISDTIAGLSDLLGGGGTSGGFTDWWEGVFSPAFALLKTANTAAGFAGKLPGMDGVSYINMNSLEAMADSCRTLCMKMWTGYAYKYVTITDMTYDKDGKEDDVFRASLKLQEMPVLAVTRPKNKDAASINRNWAVTAVTAAQGALISPLIAMTGVKKASDDKSAWTEVIGSALNGG
jgi:hypothetical protein